MRLVDADLLKSIMDGGDIVIDEGILELETPHEWLVYLLAKVELFLNKAIDGLPEHKAEWEKGDHGFYYCSGCRHEAYWDTDYGQQKFNYCPYCGARMEESHE